MVVMPVNMFCTWGNLQNYTAHEYYTRHGQLRKILNIRNDTQFTDVSFAHSICAPEYNCAIFRMTQGADQ